MDGLAHGESGRLRLPHDRYVEPLENIAGLVIGLRKAKVPLPPVMLDFCAGAGGLCRGLMKLEPGLRVFGSDLHADPSASDLYVTTASVDATNVSDLELALKLSGATGIVSNPPFDRRVNNRIVEAGLTLLRARKISILILMQKVQHAFDCQAGYDETLGDPLFTLSIPCVWRSVLFAPRPGERTKNGKMAHAWLVWTEHGRQDLDCYRVCPIDKKEARAAMADAPQRRSGVGDDPGGGQRR
jgi:hypothetical protein